MQPIIATLILMVAGRGIAQLLTGGQIITIYYAPFFFLGNGFLLGLPFAVFIAAAVVGGAAPADDAHRARPVHPGDRHQPGGRARRRRARAADHGLRVRLLRPAPPASPGLVISSNVKSADGNNAGMLMELDAILAVTLGGTLLTGGRFSLAGSVLGALIIQTLTSTIYSIGVPPEINMVVKAARRLRRDAAAVGRVPRRGARLVVRPGSGAVTAAAAPRSGRCASTRASCR